MSDKYLVLNTPNGKSSLIETSKENKEGKIYFAEFSKEIQNEINKGRAELE